MYSESVLQWSTPEVARPKNTPPTRRTCRRGSRARRRRARQVAWELLTLFKLRTFYASGPAPCSFVNGSFTVSASAVIKISRRPLWLLRARILRPNSMRSRVDAPRNRSDGWIANLVSMELATNDSLNSG
jgi:hypothetical protein